MFACGLQIVLDIHVRMQYGNNVDDVTMMAMLNSDELKIKHFVLITILGACCDVHFASIVTGYIVELALTIRL